MKTFIVIFCLVFLVGCDAGTISTEVPVSIVQARTGRNSKFSYKCRQKVPVTHEFIISHFWLDTDDTLIVGQEVYLEIKK